MSDEDLTDRSMDGNDMEEPGREHGIRRILVALDPSQHSRAALEAGARMAARLDAELLGLFVEDVNVRRLTELPFVQEVGFFTASCRQVETQELSRQLRVQAGRVRRRFTGRTRNLGTRCTFRVVRGRVAPELLTAAAEADVVIMGKGAWSAFHTERLAPVVREVLSQAPASTLVLREGTQIEPPFRVVYDGTSRADKAIAVAADLAKPGDGGLVIFLLADDPAEASQQQEAVRDQLVGTLLEPTFQTLSETSVSRLAYLVAHEEGGTLILPAEAETLEDEALLDFLDETRVPVLLIR